MTTMKARVANSTSPAKKAVLAAVGLVVGVIFIFPYAMMLITALKPRNEMMAIPSTYLPTSWDWNNFADAFEYAPIAQYLKNTWIVAASATALVIIVAIPAAYYVARNKFRGRSMFLLLVLVTQMFSPTALVIGIYQEVVNLGQVNTYIALIVVDAAFNLAFSVWILSGFFGSIPKEIDEAAWIDGCSRLQAMWKIAMPLAAPGIVTAVVFTFIAAWNEFVIALTLTSGPERQPITVGLTSFIGQYEVQWNFLFASALVAIVPVVILFGFIERWLVGGLTSGGVK
jgi:multiple sugar transport system permease protein